MSGGGADDVGHPGYRCFLLIRSFHQKVAVRGNAPGSLAQPSLELFLVGSLGLAYQGRVRASSPISLADKGRDLDWKGFNVGRF